MWKQVGEAWRATQTTWWPRSNLLLLDLLLSTVLFTPGTVIIIIRKIEKKEKCALEATEVGSVF